jgi:hypothetical protein
MFKCSNCNKQINPKIIENFSINNYDDNSCITNNSASFRPELSRRFRDFAQKDDRIELAYGSISPCTGKIASPGFSNIGVL